MLLVASLASSLNALIFRDTQERLVSWCHGVLIARDKL